ncbi:MAG: hypothetical protein LBS60_12950 [Deltaproteobacteria bacterium]|jgi:hypothetical protein|nr:hypothetical protein [Deltaproteobacteria bacterium]
MAIKDNDFDIPKPSETDSQNITHDFTRYSELTLIPNSDRELMLLYIEKDKLEKDNKTLTIVNKNLENELRIAIIE